MKNYPDPSPRAFNDWLRDLGLRCETAPLQSLEPIAYDDFIRLTETCRLVLEAKGPLYDFWRIHGDIYGEARTVEEWLRDLKWELVDPTQQDEKDLNLFLGYDAFCRWSSGKVDTKK